MITFVGKENSTLNDNTGCNSKYPLILPQYICNSVLCQDSMIYFACLIIYYR